MKFILLSISLSDISDGSLVMCGFSGTVLMELAETLLLREIYSNALDLRDT